MDFKISHGGFDDIFRHVGSAAHKAKSTAVHKSSHIMSFFSSSRSNAEPTSHQMQVICAETLFTSFLVEHNCSISAADHAGKLFREMFPGNPVAKDYKCGRTKTAQIIQAISAEKLNDLAVDMQTGPFVFGTDGSQEGGEKYFPIVVSVLRCNKKCTELLSIPTCTEAATGENIYNVINSELKGKNIDWNI